MRLNRIILFSLLAAGAVSAQNVIVRPPTVIPGGWETRKVGAVLNVTASGTAKTIALTSNREPMVELSSNKGETIRTSRGKNFQLAGVTYQPMGYKHGGEYYLLYAPARKKFYYFKTLR